ncbi:TPA: restriction endonuclease subunit S [Enterococcus faecalis]|nr:restriction endonuclease subunit S [Enterococcus faecalis]
MIVFTLIGVWELCKLGEESDVRDGTHDSPKYFDDGYPLVTSKNLKDFGLDLSDVSLISYKDFKSINKRSKVDIGDILFGMIGTIGNPVQIFRDDFAIKNVALIKEQRKILNGFLIHILKSPVFDRYIRNENAGGTQKFLALSKVRGFEFLRPNIEEQVRIGNLFKQIDNTITLHQRKLDQLKELKKAYLQLLLAQTNESKPKVRLANFEEDWQLCKVGEIFNVTRGNVLSANHVSLLQNEKNPYPVYSSQTKNNGLMGYYDDYLFDTAITWTTDGANAGTVKFRDGKFYSTNVNGVLLSECGYANQLIAEILNKVAWKHVSRVGNPKLMNNTMSEILIKIPTHLEEQKELAEIFLKLDKKTTILEHKVNQMKILKKSYLQNMFI